VVFNVLRICFLFSINDVCPDPLSSPGELSSNFFCSLFISYTTKDLHPFNKGHYFNYNIFFLIKVKIVLVLH